MILRKVDYIYITRHWSGQAFAYRDLLPVDFQHPIPILDLDGKKKNPPMIADIYHLFETATMLANADRFTDAANINHYRTGAKEFNTQVNEWTSLRRLADFAQNFATDIGSGILTIEGDCDPRESMMAVFDSKSGAYESVFGGYGISRLSDPNAISETVLLGDDLRKAYRDLGLMNRLVVDIGFGMNRASALSAFGHYESITGRYALLGPYLNANQTITRRSHYKEDGEWREGTPEVMTEFYAPNIYYDYNWRDGEIYNYCSYDFPTSIQITINRTSEPADFVRVFHRYTTAPSIYTSYSVFGEGNGTTYATKYGIAPAGTVTRGTGNAFNFTTNYAGIIEGIISLYEEAVPEFHYRSGTGRIYVRFGDVILDTGSMTLPTALPEGWHYP